MAGRRPGVGTADDDRVIATAHVPIRHPPAAAQEVDFDEVGGRGENLVALTEVVVAVVAAGLVRRAEDFEDGHDLARPGVADFDVPLPVDDADPMADGGRGVGQGYGPAAGPGFDIALADADIGDAEEPFSAVFVRGVVDVEADFDTGDVPIRQHGPQGVGRGGDESAVEVGPGGGLLDVRVHARKRTRHRRHPLRQVGGDRRPRIRAFQVHGDGERRR